MNIKKDIVRAESYSFDKIRAALDLKGLIDEQRSILKSLEKFLPPEEVFEKRLSLNNLELLSIAIME